MDGKWPGCINGKMRKCRNAKLESSCATQPASVGGCLAWINTGNPDHSISTTYFCILPITNINLHLFLAIKFGYLQKKGFSN